MLAAATFLASLLLLLSPVLCDKHYDPTWDSLDTRPLPSWYNWKTRKNPDIVKFMQDNYPPNFGYEDFAPMFKAELFDPEQWADIIEASGAKYVTTISNQNVTKQQLSMYAGM